MEKKYTVFVSSTYRDLRNARQAVANTILELEHVPVGMELFSAADEPSWDIIRQQLDLTDYLVLVIAHRYGSELQGVSYVEKEYDYATENVIPVVAFFQNGSSWDVDLMDPDGRSKRKLEAFKAKVRGSHQVVEWTDVADLGKSVMSGLVKQMKRTPREGWTRGSQVASADVLNEIARLSEENARLRANASSDSRFSLIDSMADDVMCQAVIYMYETGKDLPRNAPYIFGYGDHPGGSGMSLGGLNRNTLEGAGIIRPGGGGRVITLTEEGKQFGEWLIKKNRKCGYFRTSVGGWGKLNPQHVPPSYLQGIPIEPDETVDSAESGS